MNGLRVFAALIGSALALGLPARAGAKSALDAANDEFHRIYNDARRIELARSGPVILTNRGQMVLLHQGKRTEVCFLPPLYHSLKSVSHIPLAIYVRLSSFPPGRLDRTRIAELERFRRMIAAVRAELPQHGFDPPQLSRQRLILEISDAALARVISRRKVDGEQLVAFARRMAPLTMQNATEAAAAQLGAIDGAVRKWRRTLPPHEWNRLQVVVCTAHMPRVGEVAFQYFQKLLGEPREGGRIVVAEAVTDEGVALRLLGAHRIDSSIASAFFRDPERMHRDLLSDAARDYLQAR